MNIWRRGVLLILLMVLPLQLLAGSAGLACLPSTPDTVSSQHAGCLDDSDQGSPHEAAQCEDHCAGCIGNSVSLYSAGFLITAGTAGRLLLERDALFPANPYFRLLRPPRG